MLKIVLIQPPLEDYYLTTKRTIPYGLACIAASLEKHGFFVEIFDALATKKSKIITLPKELDYLNRYYDKSDLSPFSLFHNYKHYGYSYQHIGKTVRDIKPFLVGISSLFSSYSAESLKTAESVKKFYPECKIVMGGHHATIFPEKILECSAVDFVLRGDGEVGMPILAKTLCSDKNIDMPIENSPIKNVPGIAFRKENGSIYKDKPAWMKDLNSYPIPSIHLINNSFYSRGEYKSAVIVTSRGCPMKCSYCSVGASSSYAHFRQRTVQSIIQEMKNAILLHNVRFIDFEDENLTLNKKWFLSLMQEIRVNFKDKQIELRAMNGLFPPSLDEQVISAMKKTGFKTLNLSLGSTSKMQLAKFQRPDVTKAFENALVLAKRYCLETVSYLIAGAFDQDATQSLKDILYLAEKKTLIGLSIFYPSPGSVDYNLCKDKGILPKKFSMMRSTALPISDTTVRLESVTLLRLTRILNFMKLILDQNQFLPKPQPFKNSRFKNSRIDTVDRIEIGKKLLSWFLYDGIIRGVTQDGYIYEHYIQKKLTELFLCDSL